MLKQLQLHYNNVQVFVKYFKIINIPDDQELFYIMSHDWWFVITKFFSNMHLTQWNSMKEPLPHLDPLNLISKAFYIHRLYIMSKVSQG